MVTAGDWPSILGPNRNCEKKKKKPIEPWDDAGPKVAWKIELGEGFSGAAIRGDRAVVFHRVGDKEIVQALKMENGDEIWTKSFPTDCAGSYSPDGGPLCVPTISGDRVVVFGVSGSMHCLNLTDGAVQWSRDLHTEFDAPFAKRQ